MPTFVPIPAQQKTGECRQHPPVMDKQQRGRMSTIIIPESDGMYTPDLADAAYLPDDLNWRVLTPSQAVKAIAKANSHLSPAMVVTRSWTPKGSYGRRGWAHRHNTFVAVDGKANQYKVYHHQGEISHNGGCQKCGKVFAEFTLKWAAAPDGWLKACPACVSAWHLHTENIVSPFYFIGMNPRPAVSKMVQPAFFAYRIFVDLTRGGAVEVAAYSDYQDTKAHIESGVETLKTWVREHSRDSLAFTMNEMVLVATVLSDTPGLLATMRQELHLIEYLVGKLGECESFLDLMTLAAKAKETA